MANGLKVVSIRIPAVETSNIGKYMYYYDEQDPEKVAKAILAVPAHSLYDERQTIRILDDKFQESISSLLL